MTLLNGKTRRIMALILALVMMLGFTALYSVAIDDDDMDESVEDNLEIASEPAPIKGVYDDGSVADCENCECDYDCVIFMDDETDVNCCCGDDCEVYVEDGIEFGCDVDDHDCDGHDCEVCIEEESEEESGVDCDCSDDEHDDECKIGSFAEAMLFMEPFNLNVTVVNTVAQLRQALSASPGALNGSTVRLGTNLPEITDAPNGAGLFIGRNVTLDLNGFELSVQLSSPVGKSANCIKIGNGVTFTVMCSTSTHLSGLDGSGFLRVRNGATGGGDIQPGFGAGINTTDGTLIIQSGRISAFGSGDFTGTAGASIGGGQARNGGTVIINGGNVQTQTSGFGAGIGGGDGGSGGNITINGGIVTASGGSTGSGIGGGRNGGAGNITINNVRRLTARSGTVNSSPGRAIGPGGGSTDFGTIRISGNYQYLWSLHTTFNPDAPALSVSWNNTSNPFGNNRYVDLNDGATWAVTLHFTGLKNSEYDGQDTYVWQMPNNHSGAINLSTLPGLQLPELYAVGLWYTDPELTNQWTNTFRVSNLYALDNVAFDNESAQRAQNRSNTFIGVGADRFRNILIGADFTLEQSLLVSPPVTTHPKDVTYHNLTDSERTVTVNGNFRHFTVNATGELAFSENVNTIFTRSPGMKAGGTNGGGVHINSGGIFNMRGGAISGNKAENGGGVFAEGINARFIMTGGTLSNNIAVHEGGGVFITHFPNTTADAARINIGAGAVFTGNTAGKGSFRLNAFADTAAYTPQSGRMITAGNLKALHGGHSVPTLPGPIFFAAPSHGANSAFLVNNFDINFVGRDEDMIELPLPSIEAPNVDFGEVYLIRGMRYRLNGTATTGADAGLGAGNVTDMSGAAGNFIMTNANLLNPEWSLSLTCSPFINGSDEGARAVAIRNSDRQLRLADIATGILNVGTVYDAARRAELGISYDANFNWNDLIFDILAEITGTGNPGSGTEYQSTFTWMINNVP